MHVLAIDPGPTMSGAVLLDVESKQLVEHERLHNRELIEWVRHVGCTHHSHTTSLAVEMIASYGMPVGAEVFDTCVWIGRFVEAWGLPYTAIYRREVKLHLCGTVRAKDGNVRRALLDRFGPVGTKSNPGPLYGVSRDVWAALAVAVAASEGIGKRAS